MNSTAGIVTKVTFRHDFNQVPAQNTIMKRSIFASLLFSMALLPGCQDKPVSQAEEPVRADTLLGKIEYYSEEGHALVDSTAKFEIIGSNYTWSEGPLWVPESKTLLFSDVPENKIYQWKEGQPATLYLTPSGYTDTARRDGENGSNGLTLDKNGQLLLCQSGDRTIARMNASLLAPKPAFTILSSNYNGKKFNSPNDLVTDRNNNIYFTDPIYGLPKHENDPTRELPFEGVYRVGANGQATLLIDSIKRPNGIALSPDEKTLYVASSDGDHPRWHAYQLNDEGKITGGGILLDATDMKNKASVKQGADGFKIDGQGNIFSSGPDGINIISPTGKRLALIRIFNRPTSNCAFNEDKTRLFITADDVVIKVDLH